jgi:hypothetical protein
MGRFETEALARADNLAALVDLSGRWIDVVRGRHPTKAVVLDMDSSVSPVFGEQEGGHVCQASATDRRMGRLSGECRLKHVFGSAKHDAHPPRPR